MQNIDTQTQKKETPAAWAKPLAGWVGVAAVGTFVYKSHGLNEIATNALKFAMGTMGGIALNSTLNYLTAVTLNTKENSKNNTPTNNKIKKIFRVASYITGSMGLGTLLLNKFPNNHMGYFSKFTPPLLGFASAMFYFSHHTTDFEHYESAESNFELPTQKNLQLLINDSELKSDSPTQEDMQALIDAYHNIITVYQNHIKAINNMILEVTEKNEDFEKLIKETMEKNMLNEETLQFLNNSLTLVPQNNFDQALHKIEIDYPTSDLSSELRSLIQRLKIVTNNYQKILSKEHFDRISQEIESKFKSKGSFKLPLLPNFFNFAIDNQNHMQIFGAEPIKIESIEKINKLQILIDKLKLSKTNIDNFFSPHEEIAYGIKVFNSGHTKEEQPMSKNTYNASQVVSEWHIKTQVPVKGKLLKEAPRKSLRD